jgi:hypothetical protein
MGDADLHELAKGWKAAIVRATDPATKYVVLLDRLLGSEHCTLLTSILSVFCSQARSPN